MAEQYSWDKAIAAGYNVEVQPITRYTIADGDLYNSDVVEVFSSRDEYLNDTVIDETNSANSVYTTVNTNSAQNWDNKALSGFSAVKVGNDTITGVRSSSASLHIYMTMPNSLSAEARTLRSESSPNCLYFTINSAYGLSYHDYARNYAQHNTFIGDFDNYTDTYTERTQSGQTRWPNIVFGDNCNASALACAIVGSSAKRGGVAAFNSSADGCRIALIDSCSVCPTENWAASLSVVNSKSTNSHSVAIAVLDSIAESNQSLAIAGSYTKDDAASTAAKHIAMCNSTAYNMRTVDTETQNPRYTLNNCGITLVNSKNIGGIAYGAVNCDNSKDIYGQPIGNGTSLLYANCTAVYYTSIGMQSVYDAQQLSFALNHVSGVTTCLAMNNCGYARGSILLNNCYRADGENLFINNVHNMNALSIAMNNVHSACNNDNVTGGGIMLNDCYEMNIAGIAINEVHSAYMVHGLAINHVLQNSIASAIKINDVVETNNQTISIDNVHNMPTPMGGGLHIHDVHNCTPSWGMMNVHDHDVIQVSMQNVASAGRALMLMQNCYPISADKLNWYSEYSDTVLSGMHNSDNDSVAMQYSVAKHKSFAIASSYAYMDSVAIYNSSAGGGSTKRGNAFAMWNSSAEDNHMSLANNKLRVEHRPIYGIAPIYVNDIRYDVRIAVRDSVVTGTSDAYTIII